jgi:3'-phosphoadenosine 5'-phosphosulfate sulfotransferase (PAPS reductase)/FAD synthetase
MKPCRPDDLLEACEAGIRTATAALVTTNRHVALSYSGGAESGLLLHLLRDFREWLTVVWVNPGALPHEAEHVRRQVEGWPRFVELPSDREAAWREHGMPTWLLPVEAEPFLAGDGERPAKPLTAFPACCNRVRSLPQLQWATANKVTLFIHGQRRGEGTRLFDPGLLPAHWGPLATWTRAEVMARVAHHGVPLPRQYAEGYAQSFECATCPADTDPARLAFLARHYPAEHAESLRLVREAAAPGIARARAIAATLAEMEGAA